MPVDVNNPERLVVTIPQGRPGMNGQSAYQIAVSEGFEGTVEEWIESLAGEPGADGRGIETVVRTSGDGSPGSTDIYTITFTDDTTTTFTVHNGADGVDGVGDGLEVPADGETGWALYRTDEGTEWGPVRDGHFAGDWNDTDMFWGGSTVVHNGSVWGLNAPTSTVSVNDEPGVSGLWVQFPSGGAADGGYRGAWDVGTAYLAGDVVLHSDSVFGATADNTGSEPVEPTSDYSNDFADQVTPTEGALWSYTESGSTIEVLAGGEVGATDPPTYALVATGGTGNTNTDIELTLDFAEAGSISFDSAMDNGNAGYVFFIDEVQQFSVGNHDWTHRSFDIDPGEHTFRWSYSRGSFVSGGNQFGIANLVTLGSQVPGNANWDLFPSSTGVETAAVTPTVVGQDSFYVNSSSGLDVTIPDVVEADDVIAIQVFSSYTMSGPPTGFIAVVGSTTGWVPATVLLKGCDGTEGGDVVHLDFTGSDSITAYVTVVRGAGGIDGYRATDSGSNDVLTLSTSFPSRISSLVLIAGAVRVGGVDYAINLGEEADARQDTSYSSAMNTFISTSAFPLATGTSPSSGKQGISTVSFGAVGGAIGPPGADAVPQILVLDDGADVPDGTAVGTLIVYREPA